MTFKAVIFDWAGTIIDFGSFAPTGAFTEAFREHGLDITVAQAREPMGMAKWDHIEAILKMPGVAQAFNILKDRTPNTGDVDEIYETFVPLNRDIAAKYADLVPGALDMIRDVESRGIRIGSTTGYTRSIMNKVIPVAAEQGYNPEIVVCSDEVSKGRPAADAMRKCFEALAIDDPSCVIKVDDTEPGIGEGVSAGCVTVGVTLSGNFAGLTPQELAELDAGRIDDIRKHAGGKLTQAGADYVIDTVADLPDLLNRLER